MNWTICNTKNTFVLQIDQSMIVLDELWITLFIIHLIQLWFDQSVIYLWLQVCGAMVGLERDEHEGTTQWNR